MLKRQNLFQNFLLYATLILDLSLFVVSQNEIKQIIISYNNRLVLKV